MPQVCFFNQRFVVVVAYDVSVVVVVGGAVVGIITFNFPWQ